MILLSGQNSKDKAYKLSADYPYRANAIKVVLSVAQSLYDAQSPVIGVSTWVKYYGNRSKIYHFALQVSQYTFNYVTSWYTQQGISFYLIAPINLSDNSDDEIFGEYLSCLSINVIIMILYYVCVYIYIQCSFICI
jgi:hypothetical protein